MSKILDWLDDDNNFDSLESESEESETDEDIKRGLPPAVEAVECGKRTGLIPEEEPVIVPKEIKKINKIPSSHSINVGYILEKCKELHKKWADNPSNLVKTWNFDTDEDELFSTHGTLMDDMIMFCLIFCNRGTSLYRIIEISKGHMKEVLQHLAVKYEIVKPKKNEWYSRESITLERIVRCYPDICCDIFAKEQYRAVVDSNILGEELEGCRKAMLCPLFPSVACSKLLKRGINIIPELLWIAYKYDEKITDNTLDLKALWSYVLHALWLHLIPEEIKINLCKKWELITPNGNQISFFSLTRPKCMENLENVFGDNPDWPLVKHQMNNYTKHPLTSFYCDRCLKLREDLFDELSDVSFVEEEPSDFTDLNEMMQFRTTDSR